MVVAGVTVLLRCGCYCGHGGDDIVAAARSCCSCGGSDGYATGLMALTVMAMVLQQPCYKGADAGMMVVRALVLQRQRGPKALM